MIFAYFVLVFSVFMVMGSICHLILTEENNTKGIAPFFIFFILTAATSQYIWG